MHLPDYEIITRFSNLYKLSDNETMILDCMTQRFIDLRELSDDLGMPLKEVKKHINNVVKKTKVNNRVEVMALIVNYLLLKEVKK